MEHHDELKEYLRSHLEQGFNSDELIAQLKSAGWQDDHIQPALQWATAAYTRPAPALHEIPPATLEHTQIANPQPHHATASRMTKLVPVIAGFLAALLLISTAAFFYIKAQKETPEQMFKATVVKSMQTGTFRQKITSDSNDNGTIVLDVKSDFSDPKNPKIAGTFALDADLNKQASIDGSLSLKLDVVAIKDKVYIKPTELKIENLTDEVRQQIRALSPDGSLTVEDLFRQTFDLGKDNEWRTYDFSEALASESSFGKIASVGVSAINTVLGEFIIGNLGSSAKDYAQKALASGMYSINYKEAKSVKEGGDQYESYKLGVSHDKAKAFQTSLADSLGLSKREKEVLDLKGVINDETATLLISPKTHLPHKVSIASDVEKTTVEYSDYGGNYSIAAPL